MSDPTQPRADPVLDRTVPPDKLYVTAKAVIRRGAELLLLREQLPNGDIVLDLPGGRLDIGEDIEPGLRRELFEELGVEATSVSPLPIKTWTGVNVLNDGVVALAFAVELASGERTDAFDHSASPEVLGATWVTAEQHAASADFLHKPAITELLARGAS